MAPTIPTMTNCTRTLIAQIFSLCLIYRLFSRWANSLSVYSLSLYISIARFISCYIPFYSLWLDLIENLVIELSLMSITFPRNRWFLIELLYICRSDARSHRSGYKRSLPVRNPMMERPKALSKLPFASSDFIAAPRRAELFSPRFTAWGQVERRRRSGLDGGSRKR